MPLTRRTAFAAMLASPAAAQEPLMRRPQSYHQRRYAVVVRQVLEYSCGSASLATLLTYYLSTPTTEVQVITILRQRYPQPEDWQRKQATGFSFEDIIFAADRLGFAAQAARIDVAELPHLAGPVIVHLNKGEWQHFSVLRAARAGGYHMADPIQGEATMLEHEFRREFTGAVLAVWRRGEPLPRNSPLQAVRDGVSVETTISRAIQNALPHPAFVLPY